jgi:AraC family transcriptional regulator of adaptative response/methylated-DNA-[protein]-cysteine methyltransferase
MTSLPIAEMEAARLARDASYDGVFYVAVRTTGIFCRPSCSARTPRPENVGYFPTVKDAVFAGFRPCKRCRPLEARGRPPEWVQRVLDLVESDPSNRCTDADLRALELEPARVRRWFQEHYGMTFHAYARGRRLTRAFERIKDGADADRVAYEHGFESLSGFRDAFQRAFGETPGRATEADPAALCWIESPVGPLVAGATEEGLCLLEFTDRRMLEAQLMTVQKRLGRPLVPGTNDHLMQLRSELDGYFAGSLREFTVPLVYPGTEFQIRVWEALREIPYGETRSYEELAASIGRPGAQRAVGHANGLNRMAIVIPCHRVVNKGGGLGGYGGGLWRKQVLLDLERGAVQGQLAGFEALARVG